MRRVILGFATVMVLASASQLPAAIVTYAGLADNAGPSATTVYGTAGYDLYGTAPVAAHWDLDGAGAFTYGNRITLLPGYISSITANGANWSSAGWYDYYATIDNPLGGTVRAGFMYNRSDLPNDISERNLLDLTVGSGAPAAFYVGVLTDTSSVERDCLDRIRLRQTAGVGSGDSGLIAANGDHMTKGGDVYFFKVENAKAGDIITISGIEITQSPSGRFNDIALSGLLFQSDAAAIPEPVSAAIWSVLAMTGVGFGWRRHRR